jgi:hypothetical protein
LKSRTGDNYSESVFQAFVQGLPECVKVVGFTGGEPFADPARLLECVGQVYRLGIVSAVVTNGLWRRRLPAQGPDSSNNLLENLLRRGLRFLSLSLDEYHRPSLTCEEALELVRVAMEVGLKVSTKGTGRRARGHWLGLRRAGADGVVIRKGWEDLEQIGMASGLEEDRHVKRRRDNPCATLLKPLVDPEGRLMACCSARMLQARGTMLELGNLLEVPLGQLLDVYRRDFLIAGIVAFGPHGFFRRVMKSEVGADESSCALCVRMLKRTNTLDAARKVIEEDLDLRKEIVGRVMLLEKHFRVDEWGSD